MGSLIKHFCFVGQLNKTNPKYNYNPYDWNYTNIYNRNYEITISTNLIINSTVFKTTPTIVSTCNSNVGVIFYVLLECP